MALLKDYPKFGPGAIATATLNPAYTSVDTFNAALQNNGAQNDLGSLAVLQTCNEFPTANGRGTTMVGRYVRYNSTANPALIAFPAPVYWKDETFTVVTGVLSEGFGGANSIAGIMLVNTASLSGITAATLNGNFIWIAVSGFVPGVTGPAATAAGDAIIGAAGNFTLARVAQGTAPTNLPVGFAASAVASTAIDLMMTLPLF